MPHELASKACRIVRQSLIAAVLASLALGSGLVDASAQPPVSATPSTMQHFVIVFRQGPHPLTDADKARRQREVSVWARIQNDAGHKLEPRILGPEVSRPATHGAQGSGVGTGAWPITALLFLEARDLDQATKIATSHPANDFNASVEVRPWAPPPSAPAAGSSSR